MHSMTPSQTKTPGENLPVHSQNFLAVYCKYSWQPAVLGFYQMRPCNWAAKCSSQTSWNLKFTLQHTRRDLALEDRRWPFRWGVIPSSHNNYQQHRQSAVHMHKKPATDASRRLHSSAMRFEPKSIRLRNQRTINGISLVYRNTLCMQEKPNSSIDMSELESYQYLYLCTHRTNTRHWNFRPSAAARVWNNRTASSAPASGYRSSWYGRRRGWNRHSTCSLSRNLPCIRRTTRCRWHRRCCCTESNPVTSSNRHEARESHPVGTVPAAADAGRLRDGCARQLLKARKRRHGRNRDAPQRWPSPVAASSATKTTYGVFWSVMRAESAMIDKEARTEGAWHNYYICSSFSHSQIELEAEVIDTN